MFGALDVEDCHDKDISNSRKINKTKCWGDSDDEDIFCN